MTGAAGNSVEGPLRRAAPRALAALARRHADFDAVEDAVQEALLAATTQWPVEGVPERPEGWLVTVASRRLVDRLRSDAAARRRDEAAALDPGPPDVPGTDDTLELFLRCCHPALTPAARIALTLRAVGGLTTGEIARAFLVPEETMGRRIRRAKATIAGTPFDRHERVPEVRHVLYLMFTEGHAATGGDAVHRPDLTTEAIWLTRMLHELTGDPETAGLLALMLLVDARRAARTTDDGDLVPLADQDRTRWDATAIAEGTELITRTLARGHVGPYPLQAAIAAVHAEAARADDTDWAQIAGLYRVLARHDPGPVVALNHAVATAEVDGPDAGLAMLAELDDTLADHHRLHAVRAHLLERVGDVEAARTAYRTAARLTTSLPEQRYLARRLDRLAERCSSDRGGG